MLNYITGRLSTFIPTVREKDEGLWWLLWEKDEQGPYPGKDEAITDAPAILVCDTCYTTVSGFPAECQDVCNLSLDHTGICRPYAKDGPDECNMCGISDRLTEVDLSEVLEACESIQERYEGTRLVREVIGDEDSGYSYEPWQGSHQEMGYKVTPPGHGFGVTYFYLNPSRGSDDGVPTIFVYHASGPGEMDNPLGHFPLDS